MHNGTLGKPTVYRVPNLRSTVTKDSQTQMVWFVILDLDDRSSTASTENEGDQMNQMAASE
jgi:hypothetical protein